MSTDNLPVLDAAALTPPLNAKLITREDELGPLEDFLRTATVFGYDFETTVANSFTTRKIRTIQIGDKEQQFVVDLLGLAGSTEAVLEQGSRIAPVWSRRLTNALQGPLLDEKVLKVGQNLAFEYETGLWCLGLRMSNLWDTMLAEKCIHCGDHPFFAAGFWALDDIVARRFKKTLLKDQQKGFDLATPLRDEQVVYGALDARIVLGIMQLQQRDAKAAHLERAIQIQMDALPAFSEMKVNGMLLDADAWMGIVESNEQRHCQNVAALDQYFIPIYGTKEQPLKTISEGELLEIESRWRDEEDREKRKAYRKAYQEASRRYKERVRDAHLWEGHAALNYGSDDQVLEALRELGFKVVATNEKALSRLRGTPVIEALFAYRETKKALTTYGRAFLQWIDPLTGRIHPTISVIGAETGRTAATRPNSQQIPKQQRGCFKARPGYVLITSDMSGAELRILAELANDPNWIEAFAHNWDVHSIVAELMHGEAWRSLALDGCKYVSSKYKCKCPKHLELRDKTKPINFGVPYGLSEYALASQLSITVSEAKTLLSLWRKANPAVARYLESSAISARMKLEAHSLSGFRRKFKRPDWYRSGEIASERHVKDGKDGDVNNRDVGKVYNSAWGSIEREGKNTPIQSSNADIIKLAMGAGYDKNGNPFLWHLLPKLGAELINMVHDELVVEVPEHNAERCADAVVDAFRRAGAEFMKSVVMDAEYHIGNCWEK